MTEGPVAEPRKRAPRKPRVAPGALTPIVGRRVTLEDVARAAGVSTATVSYVLNGVDDRISEATRELVLHVAQELGHVPYAPARSLRTGRSQIVVALVLDLAIGYIANELLRRLDIALAARGYIVLVHRVDESLRSMNDVWGLVAPALVVAMGGIAIPDGAVSQDTKLMRMHGIVAHPRAGEMQIEYLHSRGHRRIGYAYPSGGTLAMVASERLAGARAACERLGLDPPVVLTFDPADPRTALAALDAWTAGDDPVTAVAAHNDDVALTVLAALQTRGLRVGEDLAVIGVDDVPLARLSLTTIAIDCEAWAETVVEAALAKLDGREVETIAHDFLALVVRETA